MLPREVLQKVRRIEITTRRKVTDVLAGEYHSIFKGRGMEFSEVREYMLGDDIRTIDWNVTSRTGALHVKKFVEERELTVLLMLDASGSADFGTASRFKREVAAEMGALLAFSAIKNNDRVGAIVFTDEVEMFIPPRKGRPHVLRVIRDLLFRPFGFLDHGIRKTSPRRRQKARSHRGSHLRSAGEGDPVRWPGRARGRGDRGEIAPGYRGPAGFEAFLRAGRAAGRAAEGTFDRYGR
jgi:uncharacterized protein (DUF58 family)